MTDWSENKSISILRQAKEGGYAVLAQVWYVRHLLLQLLTIHGIGGRADIKQLNLDL